LGLGRVGKRGESVVDDVLFDKHNTQDQALKHISSKAICEAVGNQRMLEEVLPRVGRIVVATLHVSVRVNALVCLTKTRACYGRQVLIDAVLPTLRVRVVCVYLCGFVCYHCDDLTFLSSKQTGVPRARQGPERGNGGGRGVRLSSARYRRLGGCVLARATGVDAAAAFADAVEVRLSWVGWLG
jgi:hypothetical protein